MFVILALATLGMMCIAAAFQHSRGWDQSKVQLSIENLTMVVNETLCQPVDRKPAVVFGCPSMAPGMLVTLDDGPTTKTNGLLTILKDKNMTAVFFLNPTRLSLFPKTVERIVDEGHEIGFLISDAETSLRYGEVGLYESIEGYKRTLDNIVTGISPKFLRLASGAVTKEFLNVTSALGYTVVLWNAATQRIDGKDVKHDIEITESSFAHVPKHGAILSLSENTKITQSLLQQIVQEHHKPAHERFIRGPFVTPRDCFGF